MAAPAAGPVVPPTAADPVPAPAGPPPEPPTPAGLGSEPVRAGPNPAEKKIPDQPDLNTPSGANAPRAGVSTGGGVPAAALGNRACPRSFQVITGASASTRRSYPASNSEIAPP